MSTVTFNGIRLKDAENNTGYANYGGGGPSPAAEPQLKYQGTNAVNRKVTGTTARTGVQYTHGSTTDMTSVSNPLLVLKMKVADAGDLNTTYGVEAVIGSGSGAFYEYNISGSGANNDQYSSGYNSQGGLAEGYIITTINPNIAQWREGTTGSPVLTAVDYFAVGAQFIAGGAKSENVGFDAIDIGVGLDYNGTSFSFSDGVDADQGSTNNRWGFACQNGSVLSLRGIHRIGTTSTTSGSDTSTVLFPDGYHGTGDIGIEYDTTNSTATLDGTYTGLGRLYGSDDTRPNLTFIGNDANSSTHSGSFINHNIVTLRSSVTLDNSIVDCVQLTQGSAVISNSVIVCDAVANTAVLDDLTYANLTNTTFTQKGSGHAIADTTTGVKTLTGVKFSGFGGTSGSNLTPNSGPSDAAFVNLSGGEITLNISNGESPSVRNGAGSTTIVNNSKTVTFTPVFSGSVPTDFEWRLYEEDLTAGLIGTVELDGAENSVATQIIYPYTYTSDTNVVFQIIADGYEEALFETVLINSNQSFNVPVEKETN